MEATEEKMMDESFRDSIATISKEGTRNFINPKKPKGKFYNLRTRFSIFYLVLFFTLPFIKLHGEPLLMFNIMEQKFIIFGMVFWPQDFFIFGIGMLTFVVFIILFTVVFGRVFCGWACPQTIFMEMVFRKIEYWIDGDSHQQKLLRAMPWNAEKVKKRSIKFVLFFGISFLIANFFLAYMVGMDTLLGYLRDPFGHVGTLISLLIFTSIFFFVYWWFREQVCLVVCPYGRLQGVLLDRDSIVVAYDHKRGEQRGKIKKSTNKEVQIANHSCGDSAQGCHSCDHSPQTIEEKIKEIVPLGDCIDCFACVRVCPTGIDIRDGTQLECVNCTACMDACDDIMEKVHRPKGLIRYASENSIVKGIKLRFTARIKAYSAVLLLLMGLLVFLLVSRSDLDARMMRTSGMTYTTMPDGRLSNLYNLKITNKTHEDITYQLKLENIKGEIEIVGTTIPEVQKESYGHLQFFVILKKEEVQSWKTDIKVGVYANGKLVKTVEANFMGPEIYN
ncbi:MAG: 4Fe-4S dicluster domain-containing protein [Ginsengibacter sp.]